MFDFLLDDEEPVRCLKVNSCVGVMIVVSWPATHLPALYVPGSRWILSIGSRHGKRDRTSLIKTAWTTQTAAPPSASRTRQEASDHQCVQFRYEIRPRHLFTLRRRCSPHHRGLIRLRISDRKFVNHTTEMILWSMILVRLVSVVDKCLPNSVDTLTAYKCLPKGKTCLNHDCNKTSICSSDNIPPCTGVNVIKKISVFVAHNRSTSSVFIPNQLPRGDLPLTHSLNIVFLF